MRIVPWTLLFLCLTGIHCAPAMERFELVTTQELEQMLAVRQKGETDFLLVNSLDEIIFRDISIPGSINIPWSRVDEKAHLLGSNPDKLIITY